MEGFGERDYRIRLLDEQEVSEGRPLARLQARLGFGLFIIQNQARDNEDNLESRPNRHVVEAC